MTSHPSPSAAASGSRATLLAAISSSCERILGAYAENPGDALVRAEVTAWKKQAAEVLSSLPSGQREGPEVDAAIELFRNILQSGAYDLPATEEELSLATSYKKKSWPGLLAAMCLVASYQWPDAPPMGDVPTWLWPIYSVYAFYSPQGFCGKGQADAYAVHYLRRIRELVRFAELNRGSQAVRAALSFYIKIGNCIPLYFCRESLKEHYALRAKAIAIAQSLTAQEELWAVPREDRRLRVGFINRHFGPQTESYTTVPTFEHLDPSRFEVILFTHHPGDSKLEDFARKHASDFRVLPKDLSEQVRVLREAQLDVVVFGTNLTAVVNEVTLLSLHRLAPLQVVNNSSCTTSGMPQVDLYVSGSLTEAPEAPTHFTERLGLLAGPAHAFNYTADAEEPSTAPTREGLGIPADAVLFVSAANYYKIIPEMMETWAKLLASVPGSYLLVHPFNPNWSSSYPIKRFCADFDAILEARGVASNRLIVSTTKFPSRTDVRELMKLGDLYLDSYPFGGVNSLVDPLEGGVPVAVWEGAVFRSRMGSALLRSIGLEELIAGDEKGYLGLCRRIATEPDYRDALRTRIRSIMERVPLFLDTLAASDAFGALITAAYDELALVGPAEFRKNRTPIVASCEGDSNLILANARAALERSQFQEAADQARLVLREQPASVAARCILGRALLHGGAPDRALTYLTAAVQHAEGSVELWLDIARAFHQLARLQEAVQAIDVCLRLEPRNLDAVLLMARIAKDTAQTDSLNELLAVAKEINASDPRIADLTS